MAGRHRDQGGCHALLRVEPGAHEVSHPVGTLRRWSSLPHPHCADLPRPGPRRRTAAGSVLALLRGDASARPHFDPGLAGGLRAWLEDAAYEVVAVRGEHAAPLVLGSRQLLGSATEPDGAEHLSDDAVLSRLVHALFRQLVHAGDIDVPAGRRTRGAARR